MKRNIAVIDDDVLAHQALEDCMESARYVLEGFGSGEKFVVDIQLPGVNGLQLQEKLAGRR